MALSGSFYSGTESFVGLIRPIFYSIHLWRLVLMDEKEHSTAVFDDGSMGQSHHLRFETPEAMVRHDIVILGAAEPDIRSPLLLRLKRHGRGIAKLSQKPGYGFSFWCPTRSLEILRGRAFPERRH